ncbi:FK506-binding protein 15 isoform X2 [Betta splendens]|uniref:peptidylprolyl isomerase n=1 Tax=Betta splendens TaxID=158456 RepID=A0A9W2XF17_BETSP|nr:FK506-binding protein 15 isoform X2 [Betta splendens]
MLTDFSSSSLFFNVGEDTLQAFSMSFLRDASDYQWKEFQGAKLASLFGLDHETDQGNESFQYTAPKQPRKSSNPVVQKPALPSVLYATAVQAFRYNNGQYVKQGKLGVAVLGNHTTKEYKLLLYMSQQKQVTVAKIHAGFVFTVQPNNYCTFYDDQRQNWSLMFESKKVSSNFCKEVCLAKANSTAPFDTVVVQDITLGEGQSVDNGDFVEVVYTGWLLQNHTFGQVFDSNHEKEKLLRLKIGTGKVVKGWEEGMVGMKKAGSRILIVPPNLAYGSKGVPNCIPANSTLIFEIELRRVKLSKDSCSDQASARSRDSAAPSPIPSPAPSVENLAPEPSVQTISSGQGTPGDHSLYAKSNSLSEQLTNPDATKAKLISRMAKMGQPMLPFLTGVASQPDSSDSEHEDISGSTAKHRAAAPLPPLISTEAPTSAQASPSAVVPVVTSVAPQPVLTGRSHAFQPYSYTQTPATPSQLQPIGQVYPAQTVSCVSSTDVTSFMISEARQHNTEIRLAVGKVSDNLDQLTKKVDDLQRHGSFHMGVSSMSMETSMIVHNIQRIVQENECLKKEVFEKSARIEEQNHKIGELINQNQRHMEQSNLMLEQRNDSLKSSNEQSQARVLQAEQDKHALPQDLGSDQVRLTEELASTVTRLSQLQLEASAHQQKSIELQSKLNSVVQDSASQCQHIMSLEKQLGELKEASERTQVQYRLEKQRRKEIELKVNNLEEDLQDLKTDKEGLERSALERKKKWHAERQRWYEELEEFRKNSQQELNNLQAQLRKARTSTNSAASEQLCQIQEELEEDWKAKCEQMLASASEQHTRELAELARQRDALQDELTQLQEKFLLLKQSRKSEEQRLLQQHGQADELQALQEKCADLTQEALTLREKLEKAEAGQQNSSGDTAAEVKRVMNGVFHSLRGEFELSESYSGHDVLSVIVTTIKNVTLQLLRSSTKSSVSKEEDYRKQEDGEKSDNLLQTENNVYKNEKERNEREINEEQQRKGMHVVPAGETRVNLEVETESDGQAESQQVSGHPTNSTLESTPQETAAAECVRQEEQPQHDVSETSTEERDSCRSADPDDEPDNNLPPVNGQETISEADVSINSNVATESLDNKHVEEVIAAFGPPANPPPPPNAPQNNPVEDTGLTEGMVGENSEEPFFQTTAPARPSTAPTEEEDEEEMNMKGHPPPAPLFGDDEDDDDLDWMN